MIHSLINYGHGSGSYYGLHSEQQKIVQICRRNHNWKLNNSSPKATVPAAHFKQRQGDSRRRGSASRHLFTAFVSAILGLSLDAAIASPIDQFATLELSGLLSLGEKWLILSPLVVILIVWQISRSNGGTQEVNSRGVGLVSLDLMEEAKAKQQQVMKELERIKLKTCLLNEVHSLGKVALQTLGVEQESKRRQVDEIIDKLQELNPSRISKRNNGADSNDSISFIKSTPEIDGDWNLIYLSKTKGQINDKEFLRLSLIELLGMGLGNKQQKLRHTINQRDGTDKEIKSMLAQNTAEMRLDSLGHMEIALQGAWENLLDEQSAHISFDSILVRPVELFGRQLPEDIPAFTFHLPSFLQMTTEWKLIYLDDNIRINMAKSGALFVFQKA